MKWTFTNEQEIAQKDPTRHRDLLAYAQEMAKKNPLLYRQYKEKVCLECYSPREIPISRYCNKHYRVYSRKYKEDVRSGKARTKNYAYSDEGFNEGLNAWVHDKWHYKELCARLAATENLQSIG